MPSSHSIISQKRLFLLPILGIFFGTAGLVLEERFSSKSLGKGSRTATVAQDLPKEEIFACRELSFSQPATFGFRGKTLAEEERARSLARLRPRAPIAPVKISKHMENPNSVVIPRSQAPTISAEVRKENGRLVCAKKKDKGNKSKQSGKRVHIDRECCLDPDEIPNPRCYYPQLANNSPDLNGR